MTQTQINTYATTLTSSLQPRIYVACLAAYNDGRLYGEWIDALQSADEIYAAISEMLANSPIANAEEWAIHAYEDFGGVSISESESIETVAEMAAFLAEHGELGGELLAYTGGDLEDAARYMEENYCGEFDSKEDFARSIIEDTYDLPGNIAFYIDYEFFARDLFLDGYLDFEVGSSVHVFHHC